MSTAVPMPTLAATGYSLPADADVLTGVQSDINSAFGGGLNPSLSTPQGQLATSEAAIINDCFAQFLGIVNQTDPLYAQGRMQDAIGALYLMTRFPATKTTVAAFANGTNGTTIPAATVAQDAAGNLYSCPGATISSSGTVGIVFSNIVSGVIDYVAPLSIYQSVPGWTSITSASVVALGSNVENQQEFEARRVASVSANSSGILSGLRGAILSLDASLACLVAENPTGSPETIQGVTLPAHSLFVCAGVVNGSISPTLGQKIAQAIYSKKSPGCAYASSGTVGALNYSAIDTVSGQLYPTWFVEASPVAINFVVTLASATNPPSDAVTTITTALRGAFNGLDGLAPVGHEIGKTIYSSRFYPTIATVLPGIAILGITVGTGSTPTTFSQPLNLNQIPQVGSISVVLA